MKANSATVAVRLKVPDNTAYTTLLALKRLGIDVAGVERAEVWRLADAGDPATLAQRVRADETIFNPHLHELEFREDAVPRDGEVWIREAGNGRRVRIVGVTGAERMVSWRLLDSHGRSAPRAILERASTALLCNPATEEAGFR